MQRRPATGAVVPPAVRVATSRPLFLPALLLVTFAAKAVVLAQLHEHPLLQPVGGLDSEAYVALASRVAAGDLALGPEPFYVAPLYAYFLGAIFALTGGSLLAAKVVQITLGTLAVALVHATTRRFGGALAARAAAVLVALTGAFTFAEVTLLQSALDPFLAALALHLLARALQLDESRAFLCAGLGWGLFALNRPNALAVALGLALALALRALWARSRTPLVAAMLLAAGTLLALAPSLARNWSVAGEPILIASHGGLNFFIGNHADADGTYRRVPGVTPNVAGQARDAQRLAEAASGRQLSAGQASGWFIARALDWMRAHPVDALRLSARKLAYVFNAVELPLNSSSAFYLRDEETLLRALRVGPWLLLPLGLFGLIWRARARDAAFRLWAACGPLYALSVAAFFVAERYRQPLLLPLAVGAGLTLEWARDRLRGRDARALATGAAALAALALATSRDFGLDDGRRAERAALVEALVDTGRLEGARARIDAADVAERPELLARAALALRERGEGGEALAWLARAAAAAPKRADLQCALGQARLARGDAAGAVEPLRAAAQGAGPAEWRAAAHEKLGIALSLQGRLDEALRALDQACRLDPGQASAQLNRAVVLTQLGRRGDAREALREALRLQPDYPQARGLHDDLSRARGGH